MLYSTDDEMFNSFLEKTTRLELAIALASIGITTVVKLLGQRGMNQDPISDPGTVALLNKLRAKDPGIDNDLDGEDADGIRSLQLLCRKAPTVSTVVAAATSAPAAGSAEEEAGNATLAVAFYARLEQTQGVRVKHDMHLDYALMAQMSNLQKKNGTINRRIGLTNIVVQNKKKRSEKDLGMGLKFIDDEGCIDDTKFKYNEVTVMLRTFFTSLAAVLSYEVNADSEQSGEVPVLASDGTGKKMCVAGTYRSHVRDSAGHWAVPTALRRQHLPGGSVQDHGVRRPAPLRPCGLTGDRVPPQRLQAQRGGAERDGDLRAHAEHTANARRQEQERRRRVGSKEEKDRRQRAAVPWHGVQWHMQEGRLQVRPRPGTVQGLCHRKP